jgi:hypothetical protein
MSNTTGQTGHKGQFPPITEADLKRLHNALQGLKDEILDAEMFRHVHDVLIERYGLDQIHEATERWKNEPDVDTTPELSQEEFKEFYQRNTGGAFPAHAHDEAFHGPAGEITEAICAHSSVKPEAVLAQLLVATGIMLGRELYFSQGSKHRCNLFTVIGGRANSGKGESLGYIKAFIEELDPDFIHRFQNGFKSGEALIDAVGDEVWGKNDDDEDVILEDDQPKQLIIDEEEFAAFLIAGRRQGNLIGSDIRKLWDSPNCYQTKSRGKPRTTTGAHIGLVGNVTPDELQRTIGADAKNGLASRILWIAAQRTRSEPRPRFIEWKGSPELKRYQEVISVMSGKSIKYDYTEKGGQYWDNVVFKKLEADCATRGGMLGDILARGIPTVLRLSMIYAALDKAKLVDVIHLKAAHALWNYSVASACWIFGDNVGNWRADAIIQALRREGPMGMTRTRISEEVFHRKASKAQLDQAFATLMEYGQADFTKSGKTETWRACGSQANSPIIQGNSPATSPKKQGASG